MIPKYSTKSLTDVWEDASTFLDEYKASPFYNAAGCSLLDSNITLTYYLLYNKYGNTPIANLDENQFKFRIFGTIMQYGPTWEQKLKIQEKLRSLGLDDTSDIYKGSKAIYNHANNPETTPTTADLEEINYINDQSTSGYKKSKLEGLALFAESLRDDVTSSYIDKFRKMFRQIVFVVPHAIYVEESEDNEDES